jgi:hypothetical protein
MLIIYGIHPVLEALIKRPKTFYRLFLAHEKGSDDYRRILSIANAARIPTSSLPPKELSRLCSSEQHQGVVAEVEPVPLLSSSRTGKIRMKKHCFSSLIPFRTRRTLAHSYGLLIAAAQRASYSPRIAPPRLPAQWQKPHQVQ